MTKRFGFTLAEVLITLGIIGVVAAMTMPTLMNQTNGAQYKAAYKKALSALSQAITLNVALDDISFADAVAGTQGSTGTTNSTANILANRMNVVKTGSNADYAGAGKAIPANDYGVSDGASNTTLFFNDGSMFQFNGADAACTNDDRCHGFIDVNGLKGPNRVVTCNEGEVTEGQTCTVDNPTDIYPVQYFDQTVLPSTEAGRTVLYGK